MRIFWDAHTLMTEALGLPRSDRFGTKKEVLKKCRGLGRWGDEMSWDERESLFFHWNDRKKFLLAHERSSLSNLCHTLIRIFRISQTEHRPPLVFWLISRNFSFEEPNIQQERRGLASDFTVPVVLGNSTLWNLFFWARKNLATNAQQKGRMKH